MPAIVLTVLKFALLALLYLFIYRAVRTIVADLRAPRPGEARPRKKKRARSVPTKLVVHEGRRPSVHRLSGGPLQIGRGDSCQVRIQDTYSSQVHARLFPRDGTWILEDLGSTNGTYLNKQRISVPTEVTPGDRIRIGKTTLELKR